ncbi:hypothetical protein B0H63DRAFT_218751 [Podospora didyma]|uniref:Uncharacterized protein n=1 Tax=Podospora didyma TaxID=330526 RepID=A0AAE0KJ28_9PEZI|nr:hypothetical protein B0H63DRAFT_218751 [Podospora didyma]
MKHRVSVGSMWTLQSIMLMGAMIFVGTIWKTAEEWSEIPGCMADMAHQISKHSRLLGWEKIRNKLPASAQLEIPDSNSVSWVLPSFLIMVLLTLFSLFSASSMPPTYLS